MPQPRSLKDEFYDDRTLHCERGDIVIIMSEFKAQLGSDKRGLLSGLSDKYLRTGNCSRVFVGTKI